MKPKTVHTIGDLPDTRTAGADPLQVNARLYMQISELLNQLEGSDGERITMRERIAALVAIGRIQVLFVGLRKEKGIYHPDAGSSVRKYSTAFTKDDTGRRKKIAGPKSRPAEPEPGPDWFEQSGLADDSDDDAD
jgi:hypothetical protein